MRQCDTFLVRNPTMLPLPSTRRRPSPQRGASARSVLWALCGILLVALVGQRLLDPVYEPCPTCEHTGRLSCGAEGCVHGTVPCPNTCIKADDPGWAPMAVDGHPPDELWLRFDNPDGTYAAWTRAHIGDLVERVDGRYVNQGRCPLCRGTSRVTCPTCNGARLCATCRGRGRLRRWFAWR